MLMMLERKSDPVGERRAFFDEYRRENGCLEKR
jgi:hypothetical protein